MSYVCGALYLEWVPGSEETGISGEGAESAVRARDLPWSYWLVERGRGHTPTCRFSDKGYIAGEVVHYKKSERIDLCVVFKR